MDEEWVLLLGAMVVAFAFGKGARHVGWENVQRDWPYVLGFGAMMALSFWIMGKALLALYALVPLVWFGYYIGRAIINQAYVDLRPDESDGRPNAYMAIQVVVVVGIFWAIGTVVGVDWQEFLEANP